MIGNVNELREKIIETKEAKDASIKVLVGPEEGWENHVMRELSVKAGGFTPKHSHPWPHINYILAGEGSLMIDGIETKVKAGSFAYVPADKLHQFKNKGSDLFRFICIVPIEGHL